MITSAFLELAFIYLIFIKRMVVLKMRDYSSSSFYGIYSLALLCSRCCLYRFEPTLFKKGSHLTV